MLKNNEPKIEPDLEHQIEYRSLCFMCYLNFFFYFFR